MSAQDAGELACALTPCVTRCAKEQYTGLDILHNDGGHLMSGPHGEPINVCLIYYMMRVGAGYQPSMAFTGCY